MRPLRITLILVAIFQLALGIMFLVAPRATADLFGLGPDAPAWVHWLFAMMAARFLGYAYGMLVAARDPLGSTSWINSMIGIQVVDWIATVVFLGRGDVTLQQVTTAAFMPVLFVAALLWWHPRRLMRTPARPADDPTLTPTT
ncbi:hypothetical protein [Cellulomonas composti]|uniref:Integral membrane protein n=1 Tax=Cellulomonas composti TaxID=266130 RepID=A0A511J7Y0_9CELL|nr:hypothetical protein [Cellulomonas composti]GEL94088.1 hypothetical protein CCO02nite_07460 [Cellulomonas composti]